MRLESIKVLASASLAVAFSLSVGVGSRPSLGDEPKGLGRLFRMGGSGSNTASAPTVGASSSSSSSSTTVVPTFNGQPALSTPASSLAGSPTIAPRVTPKPRVNKPITEADPLVIRTSLGRADGGSQFGMLLQVFADGTVIDGEGVHRVGPDALKPIVDAVSSGEFAKLKGHCGGPAGDFIETVHVVVFERSLGRLRANSFSYSGNPQGCDHAVHQLQKALDELQAKLIPMAPSNTPATANLPGPGQVLTSPPLPLTAP
jgi:hypothetical protein